MQVTARNMEIGIAGIFSSWNESPIYPIYKKAELLIVTISDLLGPCVQNSSGYYQNTMEQEANIERVQVWIYKK